jgi:dipeptide/tripeptide permease
LSAWHIGQLRTWLLTWTLQSPTPALFYLVGITMAATLLTLGPTGVPIAWLHRRQPAWLVVLAVALVRVLTFYPTDSTRAEPWVAQAILVAISGAAFAVCFYLTDVLGTFVAMVTLDGVVGLVWLALVNAEIDPWPFIAGLMLIAAIGVYAFASLLHWRPRSAASGRHDRPASTPAPAGAK